MICSVVTDPGFLGIFGGFWNGLTVMFVFIASTFWDFDIYNACSHGWWYDFGFIFGIGAMFALGLHNLELFVMVFFVLFIVFIISLILTPLTWLAGIVATVIIIMLIYYSHKKIL